MARTGAQKAAAAARAAAAAAGKTAAKPPKTKSEAPAVEAPVIDKSKKVAGGAQSTVFVASKIPRGLILQVFVPLDQKHRAPNGGGMIVETVHMRSPESFRIRPAVLGFGLIPAYPIVCGFSITRDVPANLWRKYVEQNPNYEPLVQGLIAGFDTEADAMAYAREHEGLRTGMEPLAQENDPRIPTSMNENVGDVEIDDETPRPKSMSK